MTKATNVRNPLISAWTKILVHLPLRFRLWWMRRSNERQLRRLHRIFHPLIEAARNAKDGVKDGNLDAEWRYEQDLILDPTYGLAAEMLERKARKLGIRIPDKDEEKGDWIRSTRTGDWMLTDEAERKLRNEIAPPRGTGNAARGGRACWLRLRHSEDCCSKCSKKIDG